MLNIKDIINNMRFGTQRQYDSAKILAMVELNLKCLIGEITEEEVKSLWQKTIDFYSQSNKEENDA